MKIKIFSSNKTGKYATVLSLFFVILMVIKMSALSSMIRLPLPTPIIALLGIIGFVLAIISIIKNKDRSLFVMFSIVVGLIIILWMTAEFMFPH